MKKNIFVVAAIIFSSQVQSQNSVNKSADTSVTSLQEIVITANKFPQKQEQTGKVLTVITRKELEKNESRSLGELLSQQAGLFIAGGGNTLGTNQDVYLRGGGSGTTLLLVDGVPVYDVSTVSSTFDLLHLPVYQIERIEILKGGQSTLYGSDAVAGVINIISRKSGQKPISINGMLAAGSYGTLNGSVGLSGKIEKNTYRVQYQRIQTNGFSAAFDSTGKAGFDKDGFRQDIFSAGFSTELFHSLEWQFNGQYSNYRTDLDAGAFTDEKDYVAHNRNLNAGTGLTYKTGRGKFHLNYQYNKTKRHYLDDSTYFSGFSRYSDQQYDGVSQFLELYTTQRLGEKFDLVAGSDYRWQKTDQDYISISDFGPYQNTLSSDSAKINMFSLYGSLLLRDWNGFYMEAGARLNHHSKYGGNTTFSLNPSFILNRQWKFFLNLSSAFKAPSLYQLYDAEVGDPQLKPEKTTSFEGGIQFMGTNIQGRLLYFNRNTKNAIDFNYSAFRYYNNNKQHDHGIEAELNYQVGRLRMNANYTWATGKVNTTKYVYDPNSYSYVPDGDTTYNNLFRRPANAVHFSASLNITAELLVRASANIIGERYEPVFMESPILLDAYQTFDIYGEYEISPHFRLFADLRNIFNETYYEVWGFNSRGRNFMAGLTCRF